AAALGRTRCPDRHLQPPHHRPVAGAQLRRGRARRAADFGAVRRHGPFQGNQRQIWSRLWRLLPAGGGAGAALGAGRRRPAGTLWRRGVHRGAARARRRGGADGRRTAARGHRAARPRVGGPGTGPDGQRRRGHAAARRGPSRHHRPRRQGAVRGQARRPQLRARGTGGLQLTACGPGARQESCVEDSRGSGRGRSHEGRFDQTRARQICPPPRGIPRLPSSHLHDNRTRRSHYHVPSPHRRGNAGACMNHQRSESKALAWMLAGAAIIGTNGIMVELAGTPPTVSAFWRMAFGGAMLLGWVVASGGWRALAPRTWGWIAATGAFFAADLWLWHRSILLVGPGLATLLGNAQVFFMALAGVLLFGERIGPRFLAGLLLAFAGLWLMLGSNWAQLPPQYRWGVWLGLGTGVCYAAYNLGLRRSQREAHADRAGAAPVAQVLGIAALVTAMFLGGAGLAEGASFAIPSLESLLVLL